MISHTSRRFAPFALLLGVTVLVASSCAPKCPAGWQISSGYHPYCFDKSFAAQTYVAVSKSSPAQPGGGLQVEVPVAALDFAQLSALGSYEYSSWDGGHDNVYSLGLQARRPLDSDNRGSTWVGAETIYHRWVCTSDSALTGCSDGPFAHGLGINGLVVQPVAGGALNLWASGGPKWLTDFAKDGVFRFESGFGWHVRTGVEIPIGRVPGGG